jgi:hypothetical protein
VSGFKVNISLDPDRFLAALTDWSVQTARETDTAVLEAAEFLKELVQENLLMFPHPPEEATEAPAYKGPVGFITGALRDSVTVDVAPIAGYVKVYPTKVYSRINELGGWTGTDHMTWIPPRPYFRPMVEEIETTGPGGMEHIFREHWLRAQRNALAF